MKKGVVFIILILMFSLIAAVVVNAFDGPCTDNSCPDYYDCRQSSSPAREVCDGGFIGWFESCETIPSRTTHSCVQQLQVREGGPCSTSSDCMKLTLDSQICENHICVAGCTQDNDCAYISSSPYTLHASSSPAWKCYLNSEQKKHCSLGCRTDSDCILGAYCTAYESNPSDPAHKDCWNQCTNDADCTSLSRALGETLVCSSSTSKCISETSGDMVFRIDPSILLNVASARLINTAANLPPIPSSSSLSDCILDYNYTNYPITNNGSYFSYIGTSISQNKRKVWPLLISTLPLGVISNDKRTGKGEYFEIPEGKLVYLNIPFIGNGPECKFRLSNGSISIYNFDPQLLDSNNVRDVIDSLVTPVAVLRNDNNITLSSVGRSGSKYLFRYDLPWTIPTLNETNVGSDGKGKYFFVGGIDFINGTLKDTFISSLSLLALETFTSSSYTVNSTGIFLMETPFLSWTDPRIDGDYLHVVKELCSNNVDDDNDGNFDCSDPDCVLDKWCKPVLDLRFDNKNYLDSSINLNPVYSSFGDVNDSDFGASVSADQGEAAKFTNNVSISLFRPISLDVNNIALDDGAQVTIESWVKFDKNNSFIGANYSKSFFPIFFDHTWNNSVYGIGLNGSCVSVDIGNELTKCGLNMQNQWHHLALVIDRSKINNKTLVFVDGLPILWSDDSPERIPVGPHISIGASVDRSATQGRVVRDLKYFGLFGGYLDDFKIWNYARTQDQIKMDMNNYQCDISINLGCPSGFSCDNHQCVVDTSDGSGSGSGAGDDCTTHTDCADPNPNCINGHCSDETPCESTPDCPTGEVCQTRSVGGGTCQHCTHDSDPDGDGVPCDTDLCEGNRDSTANCDQPGSGVSCNALRGIICSGGTCMTGGLSNVTRELGCCVPSSRTTNAQCATTQFSDALGRAVQFQKTCKGNGLAEVKIVPVSSSDPSITLDDLRILGLSVTSNPYTEQDFGCGGITTQPGDSEQPVPMFGLFALILAMLVLSIYYLKNQKR